MDAARGAIKNTGMEQEDRFKRGEASILDLNKLHREWYDCALKAGAKPQFLKKPVAWYVTRVEGGGARIRSKR